MLMDGLDGAIYSLNPDTISVNLEPIGTKRRHVPAMDQNDEVNVDLTSHQPKVRSKKVAQETGTKRGLRRLQLRRRGHAGIPA